MNYYSRLPIPKLDIELLERCQGQTLYVFQGERLIIEGDHLVFFDRPYGEAVFFVEQIRSLVCFGEIDFDPDVLPALLRGNVRVVFFGMEGDLLGASEPSFRYAERLDLLQFQMVDSQKVSIAKWIVWGTLRQHRRFLQRSARERRAEIEGFSEWIQKIEWAIDAVHGKNSLESVAGCLGAGRSAYYQALPKCLRAGGWEWSGRSSPTPFNAMLEFTYQLISQSCLTAIAIAGLSPHCGIWRNNGDFALAKDLATEFRFLADAVVVRLINQGQVYPADFDGWQPSLTKLPTSVRHLLLSIYRKKMSEMYTPKSFSEKISYEDLIQFQVFQLRQCLLNEEVDFCPVSVK